MDSCWKQRSNAYSHVFHTVTASILTREWWKNRDPHGGHTSRSDGEPGGGVGPETTAGYFDIKELN